MNTTYHANGSVRGSCGHKHKTIAAAQACARRDQSACASLGGGSYSDRSVCRTDGKDLTPQEMDELEYACQD